MTEPQERKAHRDSRSVGTPRIFRTASPGPAAAGIQPGGQPLRGFRRRTQRHAPDRPQCPGRDHAAHRKELHLSSPATTALIDRLDKSGHVVRERQGTDRRQVQLRMTPKAYRDGGAMFQPLARHMGAAMAEFTPEELEIATRFMISMIEATVRAGQEAAQPTAPPPIAPRR